MPDDTMFFSQEEQKSWGEKKDSVPEGQTAPSREPESILSPEQVIADRLNAFVRSPTPWHCEVARDVCLCPTCDIDRLKRLAVAARSPASVVPPSERQALSDELETWLRGYNEAEMPLPRAGLIEMIVKAAKVMIRAAALLRSPIALDQKAFDEARCLEALQLCESEAETIVFHGASKKTATWTANELRARLSELRNLLAVVRETND